MLKVIKAVAIGLLIATAAIAVIVVGAFIGTVLLFLGTVAGISLLLYIFWWAHKEHQNAIKAQAKGKE